MHWAKRGAFELLAVLLLVFLLSTALIASNNHTFSNPTKLKTWISQSGLYDQLVTNAIFNAQNSTSLGADRLAIFLKAPEVQTIARSVFSEQVVKKNAEAFIDSNYAWLQGKTAQPDFKIDLTGTKQSFSQQVGSTLETYLAGLKPCTKEQTAAFLASSNIDPFALACLPATINPKAEAAKVTQELSTGPFIDQPVITAQSVSQDYSPNKDKPYYTTLARLPMAYQISQIAPYIFGVLSVIIAVVMYTMAIDRRMAVKRISTVFLIAGLLLVGLKFADDFAIKKVQAHVLTNQNASALQTPITNLFNSFEKSLASSYLNAGIAFVAIGIVGFAGLLIHRGRKKPESVQDKPARAITEPEEALREADEADDEAENAAAPRFSTVQKTAQQDIARVKPMVATKPLKQSRPTMDIMGPAPQGQGLKPMPAMSKPLKPTKPVKTVVKPSSATTAPKEPAATPEKPNQPRPRKRFIQ